MKCPYCDFENLDGMDLCGGCGADLAGLDLPAQRTDGVTRHFYEVTLADLDPAVPVTASPDTTVAEAIRLMRSLRHGAVFILEDGRLTGIFTERDVLLRVCFGEHDIEAMPLREVMTPNPATLRATAPLNQALNLMAVKGYRHVPVTDHGGQLIGFVSVRGVLRYLCDNVLI